MRIIAFIVLLLALARNISTGLRCLVCQNESIDDSDAPLARDLRILVRDRLEAGDSDEDVKAFIVERYGEFVLLKPVFGVHTALLWLGPFIVLFLGGWAILRGYLRRETSEITSLRPEEEARLNKLLNEEHDA
jgi:cytochrome c-type biogenesis protein CcmH